MVRRVSRCFEFLLDFLQLYKQIIDRQQRLAPYLPMFSLRGTIFIAREAAREREAGVDLFYHHPYMQPFFFLHFSLPYLSLPVFLFNPANFHLLPSNPRYSPLNSRAKREVIDDYIPIIRSSNICLRYYFGFHWLADAII